MQDNTNNEKKATPPPFDSQNEISSSNLLDRPHPAGYTEEWIQSLKLPFSEEITQIDPLLVFRIKNEWLALPCHSIKEVTHSAFIHTLPHTKSDVLLGITNVQGELLIAISMQNLLGIPNLDSSSSSFLYSEYPGNIVFGIQKNIFVFPADEIYGLTHVKLDTIKPVPINVSKSLKNFFSGIFILPDDTLSVGLLDDKLIINSLNENYL